MLILNVSILALQVRIEHICCLPEINQIVIKPLCSVEVIEIVFGLVGMC